jgi:hypothetical protein
VAAAIAANNLNASTGGRDREGVDTGEIAIRRAPRWNDREGAGVSTSDPQAEPDIRAELPPGRAISRPSPRERLAIDRHATDDSCRRASQMRCPHPLV